MSKAFTKEDVDPPERSGRTRSASGLPPGAANYISQQGFARLKGEIAKLKQEPKGEEKRQRIAELERILASVTIVEPPEETDLTIGFGARVTVRDAAGELRTYRILGVDELDLDPEAISWVSPIGRTLLAGKVGERVTLPDIGLVRIVKAEYPIG